MLKVLSGIYRIRNIKNEKAYIGQSKNILDRWEKHKNSLRNGKHHSKSLQIEWDIYGEENFTLEVLEECEYRLFERKKSEFIFKFDTLKNGYNESTIFDYSNMDIERTEKLKEIFLKVAVKNINKKVSIKSISEALELTINDTAIMLKSILGEDEEKWNVRIFVMIEYSYHSKNSYVEILDYQEYQKELDRIFLTSDLQ
ncbi:GIY-YIG nuclease family protein [Desulfosporosinus hippei]|uniref:Group I intron endonuclease n=1 Tax=Desulfosporosinus hippei DSM 8344 TaxID=1121419 RepID=A0A1G8CHU9_9FIRM|nr:GIY-YIG nuclease family protein [Desulfosporosinus hippei]SDH45051.1 group I intron endonuclease [Desulfosporosinus hippei DSM 8344]